MTYEESIADLRKRGLMEEPQPQGGIAPVAGAFAGSAMDAAADAVLGPFDVAIDYAGRALMPENPEASPVRAAIAEGIQKYNPAGMLRDYAKEQSAPMLADVPQRQYDPNAGILDYVLDPYVLASGMGSMVGYMGSSAVSPIGLIGRGLSRVPQAARFMNSVAGRGLSAMRGGASEGLAEGVGVYDDVTARGGGANEAIAAALKTAGLNIPIDVLTNYLGYAAENRLAKDAITATLNKLTGGKLSAAAIERGANIISQGLSGTLSEGGQETLQSTVSKKYGEGRTWGDVFSPETLRETFVTEGLPGAVVGGLTGGAFGSLRPVQPNGREAAQQSEPQPQPAQPQAPDAAQAQRLAQAQAAQTDTTGQPRAQNQPSSAPSGAPDTLIDEIISEVNAAQETAAQTGSSQEATARGNAEVVADAVNSAPLEGLEKARTREPIQAAARPQPQESVTLKQDGQAAQPVAPQPQSGNFVRFRSNGQLMQTPVDYALMEIDDLVTSNLDSGGVNPAYPAEFQPRDRSRASGMLQVSQMARDLRPELLGADEYADRGAPIIDARGNVVSGNGRTMSIRSAYRNQPDTSGARYRNWLSENAAALGLDGNAARSMRNPVLVRRLTDPQLDLRAFAEDANTPVVAGMSASEQAMKDAERLTPEILAKFVPNDTGDVLTNNGEFVQAFGDGVVDRSEMERFINREGRLSQDGARRIKNALVAKAYGDAGFLERVSESTDDDMRNLSNALTQAAPAIASAEEKMSRGLLDSKLSLRAPLIEAVRELERVREQGGNVAEVLNQQGLFGEQLSDEAKILLQFFDANKRSAKAIRTLLTDYAAAVEEKGDPRQASMFDAEGETASQLLARMAARQGKGADGRTLQTAGDQGRLDFNASEEPAAQIQRDEAAPVTATPAPSAPQTAAAYPIENARKAYTTAGETRENIEYSADEESDGSFSVSKITSTRDESGVIVATRREVIENGLDEREAEELRTRLQAEKATPPPTSQHRAVDKDASTSAASVPRASESAPPQMRLAARVFDMLKKGEKIKDNVAFARMADEAWGGTQAQGAYDMSQAYDALEMGVNMYISDQKINPSQYATAKSVKKTVAALKERVLDKLPTMSNRSERKLQFQQFSTPPNYSAVANWLLGTKEGDVVLEPSAGLGGLAVFAKNAGATVYVNELDPQRAALLSRMGFDGVFTENAEQIDNVLPDNIRPNRIIMNPPFSSSAGRTSRNDTMNAVQHIEQALERLADGGRAVMILGKGMADEAPRFKAFWDDIKERYNVRANVELSGKDYAKYGTTWGNVIVVVDKTGPTPSTGGKRKAYATITGDGKTVSLDEVIDLLEGVAKYGRNLERRTDAAGRTEQSGRGQSVVGDRQAEDNRLHGGQSAPDADGVSGGGLVGNTAVDSERGQAGVQTVRESRPDRPNSERPAAAVERGRTKTRGSSARRLPVGESGRGNVSEGERPAASNGDGGNSGSGGHAGAGGGGVHAARPDDGHNEGLVPESVQLKSKEDIIKEQAKAKPDVNEDEMTFEHYVSSVAGKEHPADLDEPAAMAAVQPPDITVKLSLPESILKDGKLSAPQIEAVARAAQSFETQNPDGTRRGFFIGDGTGVGKGREIAGIITDQLAKGYGNGKALWLSVKHDLANDARRDWEGLGNDGKDIIQHSKFSGKKQLEAGQKGVLFSAYSFFGKTGKRDRAKEIKDWLGKDFDGVIALDEAHTVNNVLDMKGTRGKKEAAKSALAVRDLIRSFPNARVVYVSATGATEIQNLAMLERLGLWGEGTAFPTLNDFLTKIGNGGMASLELVARDMKAMGLYLARSLSFRAGKNGGDENVTFSRLEHKLTDQQKAVYNEISKAWAVTLQHVHKAVEATKAKGKQTGYSQFYSSMQACFNQILTSMSIPSVISSIEQDLKNGNSVVIQLTNTNEAAQNRAAEKLDKEEGDTVDDLDVTPRDALISFLENSFPVQQYEEYEDDKGNKQTRAVVDSHGNPVLNKKAVAARDELIEHIRSIRFPDSPMDMIIKHFGVKNVAEVTGRSKTPNYEHRGNAILVPRGKNANQAEMEAFQDGRKRVLIFSDAGGTGFSFHADKTKKNQQKRIHYMLQPGWNAAKAVQGLGRTNRSNQAHKPHVILVTTDVPGQRRFTSTIARRLEQLGALTQGDRSAQNKGLFNEGDNLEGRQSQIAVNRLIPMLSKDILEAMNIKPQTDRRGRPEEVPVSQFLNRVLALDIDVQRHVFGLFGRIQNEEIEKARANGTLDTGTRTLRADSLVVAEDSIVYKNGGIETRYVKLDAGYKQSPRAFGSRAESGFIGYYNQRTANGGKGRVVQVYEKASETDPRTGEILKTYSLRGVNPSFSATINERTLNNSDRYAKLSKTDAEKLWNDESRELPRMRHETRHLLSGAILPIYNSVEMGEGGGTVLKANLDDGRSVLGLAVSDQRIGPTLRNLAAMPDNSAPRREGAATSFAPEDIIDDVMENGTEYRLQNGWRIKRSRVLGGNRVELVGPDFTQERAVMMWGVIKDIINSKPRYFIPTGRTQTLAMVLRSSPVDPDRTVRNNGGEERYRIADIRQRDAALKNEMLRGKPVARVTGDEFQNVRSSDDLVNGLYKYYGDNYGGKVQRHGIGDIYFTKKGLRSDVGHGIGREKIAAFVAVPDILTKGKILRISPNWKGRGYRSFVIGAPIEIADKRYLAIAIVNEVAEKNRGTTHGNFYLHEVSLQDIPPDASEVPDQQAYRDAGVVHAATKAGEAAHVHRSSDGPIAASAEAVQLPRGDSSSNGNVSRGDIYTLLNKVINVNSLPEITPEAINANAPGLHATRLSGGALLLEGKGGAKIFVDNRDEPLSINSEAFKQEYGRDVTPDDIATGRTIIMDKKAFIDLVNGVSTLEDFHEELYHSAEALALRPEEIAKLREDFGSEKATVEAYLNFRNRRMKRLTVRSMRFFQRIKDCFDRIRATLFGPRSEDIFRDIADGRVWDREVIESNEAVERYRASKKLPYEAVYQDDMVTMSVSSDDLKTVERVATSFREERERRESNRPDASGEVGTQSDATHTRPTFSRSDMGAGYNERLALPEGAVKNSKADTTRPEQGYLFEDAKKVSEEMKEAKKEISMPAILGKELEDVATAENGVRMEGMIDPLAKGKRRRTFKELMDAAYTAHVDDLHPILTHFGKDMYRRAANALYGIGSKAQYRLLYGDPERGVKGLMQILDMLPAEHRNGFSYYAVLKHLYDIAKLTADARAQIAGLQQQLDEGGLDAKGRERVEARIAELKKRERFTMASPEVYEKAIKKIEAAYPKWIEAQKELVKYNQALLKMLEDSGIISHDLYYDLVHRYPNYVPLQRDFGTEEGLSKFVEGRGLVNVQNPLKRLRGSERDVIDPLDQIIRNTYAFESVAARQGVAREIVKRYDNGEYDGLMEQVEDRHHAPGESIFYVYENGEKRLFKTDKDIYEALVRSVGASPQESNILTKMLSAPTRALRYGTTHSLTFGVGNLMRDTFSYAVLGKDFRPVVDTVNGFMALITNEELVRDFMRNGGLQESSWLSDNKREELIRLLKGRKTWKDNAVLNYNPISLYFKLSGAFAEVSEQASRLGQYKRLLDKGYSKEDAIFETRDNMNFMRAGNVGRSLNRFVPFYNASLQGVDKLCRTMYHDGKWDKKALARGLMYLTTLSLASCLYNYGDDDRREKYMNLRPWRKNMFWNFVIGDEVFSIPKPFEAGMLFGSLPERFMDYLWQHDKRAFDGVAQSLYGSLTPEFVPMAVSVMFELEANYSRFFGRQIVPMSEQRLDPELQYGPHTAEWAKQMAQITKYLPEFAGVPFFENFSKTLRSPRMLEYAALALTGSAGRDLSDIYNMGSRLFKGEARPSENPLVVMPGVRRLFADAKYGGRDQDAFRTEITQLKNKLDSAAHLYKNGEYSALTPYRVRLLQLEPAIKYTNKILTDRNRGINAANRTIQRITTAPNMTAKQKREAIDQINAYVLAMSREGLRRVEEIQKYLRTDKM